MYLKSLQIHGFKSFANKLVFEFNDGITGIVGPNGSGKSNVGDAVRWVLGEQSAKQLRGAKMEDVIFSGTETRKPLGFAFVAITLDNSDHKLPIEYDEVTVARRVYRSGESEYLINGNTCRLKDVQELFLDTGIGKEGYSIIGQGQIDKILSGKPEDRRELFDEAAGIVKFKKRKLTAEKNLEEERLNLSRINDILSEIEKQVKPLENQSVVAREYLKYKEDLKNLDVNMFLMEYDRIYDEKKNYDGKINIAGNDLSQAKSDYEKTKDEYEKLELQLEEYNNNIELDKNSLGEVKINKEKLESEIKVLKEQIVTANNSSEFYETRKTTIYNDIEDKTKELEKYQNDKNEITEKLSSLDSIQSEASAELKAITENIENYMKSIEELNSDTFELMNENSNTKAKLQRYEMMLEQNNIKKVELNQRLIKSKSDEVIQEDSIKENEGKLKAVEDLIAERTVKNGDLQSKVQEIRNNLNIQSKTLNDKQQEYHRERSKLDSLKNITERYEGYGNSIRKVMEQKDKKAGVIGVVADIIKVNKEYETAVEIALGGSIQNIVTDTDTTAKDLIEFLKKNKYGRATFLPLTNITNKNSFYNEKALKEPGVIGLASSLVDTDHKFDELIDYLLGRIVVVDHINNAIALAKKYNYSLRIVTIEGELLSAGGSMSGGAYKNSSNLLSRRREIEEIEKNISTITEDINRMNKQIEVSKQHENTCLTSIEENKKEVQEQYILQNTLKINLKQTLAKREEILSIYQQISNESKEIESQSKELNKNIESLKLNLQQKEDQSKENEIRIEEINSFLEKERLIEKSFHEKVASIKIDFSALEQSNQFLLENIRRVKSELKKYEEEVDAINGNIAEMQNQVADKEVIIHNTKEKILEYSTVLETLEQNIANLLKDKDDITKSHKEFFTKREELQRGINELDKEVFRLSSQKEKLMEQSESLINYMWEEYELTYNNALSLRNSEYDNIQQMKKLISDLKNKIKNLGDVNVNAIEDFKALMERYELLKTQRDDLVAAEEVLKDIIVELDTEMRKQFEEKFQEIKTQFNIVFKELFGGGKGTLELMEDEDILEAGIRIVAQPPGKKLQNMMQLSGGEKALTAVSLLFAIQNLKPSPFCLLDEIEAALDDSNVKRCARYLKKLTKHTQFIVITHRRGTMEAADVLYGITMQEKGISTLVSVNLIENELDK
ncbi:chromosome segregation protein SMC [Anaeromicropila herbilytica]|uniref:Chromosome partition protein Smc n=1 Tax=Anaeromicropila herbilytica TaxID=2785025 RepID=A0A7R7EMQ9_9FIRM|nr:chromosome segregation protein SMC [Anaeromicropila herbilytica]BCN31415.1 chromosome partition protein Smc [Anaeromicropila herbilytica]